MIILAWTIERMSVLWDEEGAHEVLIQGAGSLLTASLAFLLMSADFIADTVFLYPELLLVVLAVIIAIGSYSGYRLSDLYRFRSYGKILMFGLASPAMLKRRGVVGMNRRNVTYIGPETTPRHLYPNVDDKLKTKQLCRQRNIAVPRLLAVCRRQGQVRNELHDFLLTLPQFVIKPAKGSGGKGILVIVGREREHFLKASGERLTGNDIKRHVSNVLSGLYSLAGKPDVALIEELVHFSDDFCEFSYEGVPDIRVIVYKGFRLWP